MASRSRAGRPGWVELAQIQMVANYLLDARGPEMQEYVRQLAKQIGDHSLAEELAARTGG